MIRRAVGRIKGKMILAVPKLGWISIYLRQALAWIGGLL